MRDSRMRWPINGGTAFQSKFERCDTKSIVISTLLFPPSFHYTAKRPSFIPICLLHQRFLQRCQPQMQCGDREVDWNTWCEEGEKNTLAQLSTCHNMCWQIQSLLEFFPIVRSKWEVPTTIVRPLKFVFIPEPSLLPFMYAKGPRLRWRLHCLPNPWFIQWM